MSIWSDRVAALAAKIEADPNFAAKVSALHSTIMTLKGEEPAPPSAPPPAAGYTPSSYAFDGTNYLNSGAGLTGAVDGKTFAIAGHLNPDAWAREQHIIRLNTPFVSPLWLNAAGDLCVWLKNAAGAEIAKLRLPNSAFVSGQLNHFAFSGDLADVAKRHGYANDAEALIVDLWTDDIIDWTVTNWRLGDGPGGIRYLGQTADLGLWLEYAALSDLATRRKFVGAAGAAVDLGSDGSLATGNRPLIYLQSNETNLGTGGGFLLPEVAEPAPPPVEEGNVITATAGTFSAIQAAVDQAGDGDTVLVPDGVWAFGNGQVSTAKALHIRGNGKGVCKITRSNVSPDAMFRIDPSPNGPFEFSGITLEGHGPQGESDHGIVLRGKHRGFEIHDCAINRFGRGGISIQGYAGPTKGNAHGVIYDNTFEENGRLKPDGSGEHDFYCIEIYGDPDSDDPVALGTDQAVYVEDNEFTRNNLDCASNNNSRYVFRHNLTTERMESGGESVDAHGQGSWPEGSFSFEIYRNEIDGGGNTAFMTIGIRGGQGVVFENVIRDANHAIGCHLETAYYRDVASVQDFQTHIHDLYLWSNTEDGAPVGLTYALLPHQPENPQLIVEGEHYFELEKPGYTPFTYPHPLRG